MKVLTLPLKRKWFEQIVNGTKIEEYRLCNEYWKKRLEDKEYDFIEFTLGYPSKDDNSRRIKKPYMGFEIKEIIHDEWANIPQKVYAIKIGV